MISHVSASDITADSAIKIERPGADPARNIGPFYHDREGERIAVENVVVKSGETSTLNFVGPVPTCTSDRKLTEEQFSSLLTVLDIR